MLEVISRPTPLAVLLLREARLPTNRLKRSTGASVTVVEGRRSGDAVDEQHKAGLAPGMMSPMPRPKLSALPPEEDDDAPSRRRLRPAPSVSRDGQLEGRIWRRARRHCMQPPPPPASPTESTKSKGKAAAPIPDVASSTAAVHATDAPCPAHSQYPLSALRARSERRLNALRAPAERTLSAP
ncbi:hypothetical protein DFH06DRAFT_1346956 [Mycena polygramma]|nr:hypothetical protein DFH06DRAFT_1346956 [Mycena polygramma]